MVTWMICAEFKTNSFSSGFASLCTVGSIQKGRWPGKHCWLIFTMYSLAAMTYAPRSWLIQASFKCGYVFYCGHCLSTCRVSCIHQSRGIHNVGSPSDFMAWNYISQGSGRDHTKYLQSSLVQMMIKHIGLWK